MRKWIPSLRKLSPARRDLALALGWTTFLLLALFLPGDTIGGREGWGWKPPPGSDKVGHVALFFVESWVLHRALHWFPVVGSSSSAFSPWLWAAGVALVLAVGTEWVQHWIPGRDGDGLDLLADTLGIGLYATLIKVLEPDPYESH